MFSSPILEKALYVHQSSTGKRFYRFPVPVLEKVLSVSQSSPGKRFYVFPSLILGKGSIGFPVQYWEKVSGSSNQYWDGFYTFPSPLLGNDSRLPSPRNTGKRFYKVLQVSQSTPGKRFYSFPSPVLGKGSIGSLVQYWERVIG